MGDAERLFGYRESEILGTHSAHLFPKHNRDAIRDLFETVMAGETVSHYETEFSCTHARNPPSGRPAQWSAFGASARM